MENALNDTSDSVQQLMFERLSLMSPEERLARTLALCETARSFVLAGINLRYPTSSTEERRKRFAAILLGPEFTRRHFGWDPEAEGY